MPKALSTTLEKWMLSCITSAPALKAMVLPIQIPVIRCQVSISPKEKAYSIHNSHLCTTQSSQASDKRLCLMIQS